MALSPWRECCTFSHPFVWHGHVFIPHTGMGTFPNTHWQALRVIGLEKLVCACKQLYDTRSLAYICSRIGVPFIHHLHRNIYKYNDTHTHSGISTNMHALFKNACMLPFTPPCPQRFVFIEAPVKNRSQKTSDSLHGAWQAVEMMQAYTHT